MIVELRHRQGECVMKTKVTVLKFRRSERGASMLEYALLSALISIVVLTAVRSVGNEANKTFRTVEQHMGAGNVDTQNPD